MFWTHWNLSALRSFYGLAASASQTEYIFVYCYFTIKFLEVMSHDYLVRHQISRATAIRERKVFLLCRILAGGDTKYSDRFLPCCLVT
jgi:hypothetical protein